MKFIWSKNKYTIEFSNFKTDDSIIIKNIDDIKNLTKFKYDMDIMMNNIPIYMITVTIDLEDSNFIKAINEVLIPENRLTDSCKDFCYSFDLIKNDSHTTTLSILKECMEHEDYYSMYIRNYSLKNFYTDIIDNSEELPLISSMLIREITNKELKSLKDLFISFIKHSVNSNL